MFYSRKFYNQKHVQEEPVDQSRMKHPKWVRGFSFKWAEDCVSRLAIFILFSLQFDTVVGPTKPPNERT